MTESWNIGIVEEWNIWLMKQSKKCKTLGFEKSFCPSFPLRRESRGVSKGPGFLLSQE
jgi:hypothetical protein